MIAIRNTLERDAEPLADIQRRAFLPLYQRYYAGDRPYDRGTEEILCRLGTAAFQCFTVLEDGRIVGGVLYKCSGRAPFVGELGEGESYLKRVYIAPERQGRRIAQTAIRLCEKELSGINAFYVDFPEDLQKNRMCYEAVGFRDTGRRMKVSERLTLACYEKRL